MHKLVTRCAALMAVLISVPARAAADDCSADAIERSASVGKAIIDQLDLGLGAANHPDWMLKYEIDPDLSSNWLANYCILNPLAKLSAAIPLVKARALLGFGIRRGL